MAAHIEKELQRSSGLLMHISSLPGYWGAGDLGPSAYTFVDMLASSGQKLWQILPLTIPDMTGSPYSSYSAFAQHTGFVSPELLRREGHISDETLSSLEKDNPDPSVRRAALIRLLSRDSRFMSSVSEDMERFQKEEAHWLNDFGLFTSLMWHLGPIWTDWPDMYRDRDPQALSGWQREHAGEILSIALGQYLFSRQWDALHRYAAEKGILIIGDIPIFVAHNSVDVWAHRDIFKLDKKGFPTVVAGVPPDVFSETGQLWGNPHYRWDRLDELNYRWWFDRIEHLLDKVDYLRLDHFRGFEAAWEIPFGNPTAEQGEWVKGGGQKFFDSFRNTFGQPPIIAEDLGIITEEVEFLMDRYHFPGMKILQFSLDSGPDNSFLPWNYGDGHCVVYTGTHDNNTLAGWYQTASETERSNLAEYLGIEGPDIVWPMIETALKSPAVWAVFPTQDLLELGVEARMNLPNTTEGNWNWRMEDLSPLKKALGRLSELCSDYER